jgi:hypothetical protein
MATVGAKESNEEGGKLRINGGDDSMQVQELLLQFVTTIINNPASTVSVDGHTVYSKE